MKNLFTLALIFLLGIATYAQEGKAVEKVDLIEVEAEENEGPKMTFEEKLVNYGTIEQGSDPLRTFAFSNTGSEPLVISRAKGSCGCTVPSFPKEPIMPGEAGVIEVRYDTKRLGNFKKTVKVYTNEGKTPHTLTIKGKTFKKKKEVSVPKSEEDMFSPEKEKE